MDVPAPISAYGPRTDTSGFTLLELLVVFVVIGLIASLLAGTLSLGRRTWEAGEASMDRSSEIRLMQGLLRRHIAEIYPAVRQDDPEQIEFDGRHGSLSFVTLASEHVAWQRRPHRVVVGQAGDTSARRLVMTRRPADGGDPRSQRESIQQAVLHADIDRLEFDYFGALQNDEKPGWHRAWSRTDRLPSLIRVRVAFSDRRGMWPDLVVAPMVTAETRCLAEPGAAGCGRR